MSTRSLFPLHFVRAAGLIVLLAGAAHATAQECADGPGVADHPALPRYDGACLVASESAAFDAAMLPTGRAVRQGEVWTAEQVLALEGAVSRLLYGAPEGRSTLEVFRNYEQGLPARGFEILYRCQGTECGRAQNMLNMLMPRRARFGAFGDRAAYAFTGNKDTDQFYLVARSGDGRTHLGIYVGRNQFNSGPTRDLFGRALVYADVVEAEAMEARLVDAAGLSRGLAEQGRIVVPSIFFDTGRAALKPESDPALNEISRLLAAEAALKVYVVGHTDNVGSYDANLALSRARAEAVVEALVARHGVERARLVPAGVADLAPLASNATENGRAMNRRVELVAR
jgi:OmpA-OmpF porin, OOP family